MIKKIPVEALKTGMYIHDLNCRWIDHNFVRNKFRVSKQSTLDKIAGLGIRELYIDTAKGADVVDAPSKEDDDRRQDQAIREILVSDAKPATIAPASYEQELGRAVAVSRDANRLVSELMNDVRFGRQLKLDQTARTVERMTRSLIRNPNALLGLGRIRNADKYTFEHSVNICTLMVAFAQHLELEPELIVQIGIGAMLHDIGKIRVPEHILNKPGKLTDEEFRVMRNHVELGRRILVRNADITPTALAVVAEHHERFDGSGYPRRLRGDEISLYGQMAAIVDVYDAITSDRCYHTGMPPTMALRKIYEWSRYHFNPQLAQKFIRFVGVYPTGSLIELQSRHLALVMSKSSDDPLNPKVLLVYDTRNRRMIEPREYDLQESDDSITGYTVAEQWGLSTQRLLALLV